LPRSHAMIMLLKPLGEGMSPKRIAEFPEVARATVETHRRNIMQKLRIEDAHTLQAFVVQQQRLWQSVSVLAGRDYRESLVSPKSSSQSSAPTST
jgi:hypothetical protein